MSNLVQCKRKRKEPECNLNELPIKQKQSQSEQQSSRLVLQPMAVFMLIASFITTKEFPIYSWFPLICRHMKTLFPAFYPTIEYCEKIWETRYADKVNPNNVYQFRIKTNTIFSSGSFQNVQRMDHLVKLTLYNSTVFNFESLVHLKELDIGFFDDIQINPLAEPLIVPSTLVKLRLRGYEQKTLVLEYCSKLEELKIQNAFISFDKFVLPPQLKCLHLHGRVYKPFQPVFAQIELLEVIGSDLEAVLCGFGLNPNISSIKMKKCTGLLSTTQWKNVTNLSIGSFWLQSYGEIFPNVTSLTMDTNACDPISYDTSRFCDTIFGISKDFSKLEELHLKYMPAMGEYDYVRYFNAFLRSLQTFPMLRKITIDCKWSTNFAFTTFPYTLINKNTIAIYFSQ